MLLGLSYFLFYPIQVFLISYQTSLLLTLINLANQEIGINKNLYQYIKSFLFLTYILGFFLIPSYIQVLVLPLGSSYQDSRYLAYLLIDYQRYPISLTKNINQQLNKEEKNIKRRRSIDTKLGRQIFRISFYRCKPATYNQKIF